MLEKDHYFQGSAEQVVCKPEDLFFCSPMGLLPVSDWVDGLIGPSGLLLVVSHLRAVPVSLLWWGWKKVSN